MLLDVKGIIQEIDDVMKEFDAFKAGAKYDDMSDKPEEDAIMITTRLASTIDRLAPKGSYHEINLKKILGEKGHSYFHLRPLKGALMALRREYELGKIDSFVELVHADTFVSFLEMAAHLLDQGYKDPAAVIAGSVLEQRLRELSIKNSIPIEINGKYKKAEALNSELASASVYSKIDQKNVTSWLGLRNEAAHGNFGNYTKQQVQIMLTAVGDFLGRYPA